MKKILIILLALSLLVSLASCKKCKEHRDADDDYLCDICGENFDDGDETPEPPAQTGHKVTFKVQLDDGSALAGVKFSLVRGDFRLDLTSGEDGCAEGVLENYTYSVEFDYDSLPEYSTPDTFGIKIEDGKDTVTLVITNNMPDGSLAKPFHVTENETAVTLGAGQKVYYNYRGSSIKFLTVDSEAIEVGLNDLTYSLVAGNLPLTIDPEIGVMTLFSLENTTDSEISFTLLLTAPVGSNENPIELDGNGTTVVVNCESRIFYSWIADKDGVLTLASDDERNDISITKLLENDVIIVEQTNGGASISMEVKAGDVITIGVSALEAGSNHENKEFDIEISFTLSVE